MRYHYKTILVRLTEGVAVVKLNTQESKKDMDVDNKRELANFLNRAKEDPQIKAIVLTGKNGAFFAGRTLKVSNIAGLSVDLRHKEKRNDLAWLIRDMGKPVIAAVNGFAIGAGMKLALACHLVVASEKAKFYEVLNEELYFAARSYSARQALESGLVYRIVSDGELIEKAMDVARSAIRGEVFFNTGRAPELAPDYGFGRIMEEQPA